jgi:hypothetical protein
MDLKTDTPRASGIETFEELSLNTPTAAPPTGLQQDGESADTPEAISIEGLARTQYEGSGMFRLEAPEEASPDDSPANVMEPAVDLPLIMPDYAPSPRRSAPQAAPEEEPPRGRHSSDAVPAAVTLSDDDGAADAATLQAAEPVVTETMADLYLQQGHREDALRVYRALLIDRPGDRRLAARIRELEGPASPPSTKVPLESATAFLRRVWHGEPGTLDAAFAGAPRTTGASASGAPTRPAEDVISLDAVFGDQVGRVGESDLPPPPPPAASQQPAANASGGFSFDDFFGAAPGQSAGAAPERAPRGTPRAGRPQPEDDDLDQFQSWLKGLKS